MKKVWLYFTRNYSLPVIVCIFLSVITGCKQRGSSPFSKSAEEALSTFEVTPGFKIELIASEPLIADPVAMTIDEYGRMYVVEMAGMPLNRTGVGRIILLTDTSQDGKMDKRSVFAIHWLCHLVLHAGKKG